MNVDLASVAEKGPPQLQVDFERPGEDVMLEIIRSLPARSITYIALGPLTTLAKMIRKEGDFVRSMLGQVVCMGGALDVPGNTSPVAECQSFGHILQMQFQLIHSSCSQLLRRSVRSQRAAYTIR